MSLLHHQDDQPLQPSITEQEEEDNIPERWQLSSLCMQCGQQGVTQCLVRDIPFFHRVICMSFDCPHCGNHNNQVTCARDIEPYGIRWTLHMTKEQEDNWSRQVWISDYATIRIPQIELEIPPSKQQREGGRITTVEGIWLQVVEDLRVVSGKEETAQSIESYIEQQLLPLRHEVDFVLELEDPSGSSRIEWRVPEDKKEEPGMIISNIHIWDKSLQMTQYIRSKEENEYLGWISSTYHNNNNNNNEEEEKRNEDSSTIAQDEIVKLSSNCPCCGLLGENRIHCTDIPYFKQVLIIAFTCTHCGYKTNHIQSGLGIEERGRKITLHAQNEDDLSRSVLLSDTCHIMVPELSLQVEGSSFCKWSTVEGIFKDIAENMENQYSFLLGDSMKPEQREKWQSFLQHLNRIANGEEWEFTLILDDPAGNSYIQNICAPEQDPQLEIETMRIQFNWRRWMKSTFHTEPYVVDEKVVFQEYFCIYRRKVNFQEQQHSFDIVGHPNSNFSAALVFPFDAKKKTVTLLKEYHPGSNSLLYSFPGGLFDSKKHASIVDTAKAELNEEAHMVANQWYPLTSEQGILQDKYSRNRLHMFLAIDCETIVDYQPRDAEEYMDIVSDVDVHTLPLLIYEGKMALPSSCLVWLGLEQLKKLSFL
ncbi:Zinc finger protein ZPR1 [Galdieria sulphuraria]|nr:Zinc finger protein ZPR1 [Galdieria sulphuraria]